MAEIADTTSVTITGKDGSADIALQLGAGVTSFKTILDMFRIREMTELFTQDVFSIEGTADQEAGRSQINTEISGLGKKHGPASGPLIPAPQDASLVLTFSTGCLLTQAVNFSEFSADRLVNQNMRIAGRCLSKAVYTLTWLLV